MRVVGIRDLKARLSEYLRDVKRGDVFLVTDRGRVVAELRQPGPSAPEGGGLEARLRGVVESGEASPPHLSRDGWNWRPAGAGLTSEQVGELLDSVRSDRGGDA
jgi:antitoxin (DNA-binding transcriptional repressor) of toxin-antitoxin stability system